MATAAGSDRSPGSEDCSLCGGTGVLSWQQPQPSGLLRTVELPCPEGCGGAWKHPEAEHDRVVDSPEPGGDGQAVLRRGNTGEANRIGADFVREALESWGFLDERGRRSAEGSGEDR